MQRPCPDFELWLERRAPEAPPFAVLFPGPVALWRLDMDALYRRYEAAAQARDQRRAQKDRELAIEEAQRHAR